MFSSFIWSLPGEKIIVKRLATAMERWMTWYGGKIVPISGTHEERAAMCYHPSKEHHFVRLPPIAIEVSSLPVAKAQT